MSIVGEAVGLSLAVATAIESAAKGYLLIEAFLEKDNGTLDLAVEYHTEKIRFDAWRDYFKVDRQNPSASILVEQPYAIKEHIIRLLGHIENTHKKAEKCITKTKDLLITSLPFSDFDKSLYPGSQMVTAVDARLTEKQQSRGQRFQFWWHISRKSRFKKIKDQLKTHIDGLWGVLPVARREMMAKLVASYVIAGLSETSLQSLQRTVRGSDNLVALEARLKQLQLHQNDSALAMAKSATTIRATELSGLQSSATIIYSKDGALSRPVWIDWTIVDPVTATADLVVQRVNRLGMILETVNEAALHIPPCLGLYEDSDFGLANDGKRRLGYVFGVPAGDYESDLGNLKPITLRALLKSTKDNPPKLGDRFRLAFALASAFGLFHATGWLHKGFQPDNIIFFYSKRGSFAKADEAGIIVKEPYIKGFQYSRPQGPVSISYGPLQTPECAYYYHPNTTDGFTKSLDLYSLGVVLWEIGRWQVISDAIASKDRHKLSDPSWAASCLSGKPLDELGWRMGQQYMNAVRTLLALNLPKEENNVFFSQQYFEKVLKPLDSCYA